jgi:hypothetical protein
MRGWHADAQNDAMPATCAEQTVSLDGTRSWADQRAEKRQSSKAVAVGGHENAQRHGTRGSHSG